LSIRSSTFEAIMDTMTKHKKEHRSTAKNQAKEPPPPEPTIITGKDIKRIAGCTDYTTGRWLTSHIELSPVGLCATNGRMLGVLNMPGWPYQCYLEAKQVKCAKDEAELAINGKVSFVSRTPGAQTEVTIQHSNPDEITFPKWQTILPEAALIQPVATLNIALLKRLLCVLQRSPESSVTVYVRPDDCLSPVMLCNEAGDLGLLMPLSLNDDKVPGCHFPAAVYQAFQRSIETLPPVWIPKSIQVQQQADDTEAPASEVDGSSQEKPVGLLG
jgi:hypothetical protein